MNARAAAGPPRIWVVAADAARARIFRAGRPDGSLTEIEDLLNPDARGGARALRADRLGHAANAARGGGHSLQRNADEPRNVVIEFGRRLARRMNDARRRGEFERVYLVAEPHLLGVVRDALDRTTRRLLAGAIGKDVSRRGAMTIRARLPDRL